MSAEPQERDDELFDELVASHGRRVGAFLSQLVGDRALAEDLLQDTLLAAYRSRGELIEIDNAVAWLYAIARNRVLNARRRRRRQLAASERLIHGVSHQAPDIAEAAAVRDVLERYLEPDERALLILRYLHGFDSSELGTIFGTSPEAIRQRLSRIRRRLIEVISAPAPATEATWPRGPQLHRFAADAHDDDEPLARLVAPLDVVGELDVDPIDLVDRPLQARLGRLWARIVGRR